MLLILAAQFAQAVVILVAVGAGMADMATTSPEISPAVSAPRDILLPNERRLDVQPMRFRATVTAYSSSLDETWGDPFISASGRRVSSGMIACPRRYPFGTRVRINGHAYTCWDRLHQRFDDRFDIWMTSKQSALEFGRRRLLVEVLTRRPGGQIVAAAAAD